MRTDGKRRWENLYVRIDGKMERIPDAEVRGQGVVPCGNDDFMQCLREHAEIFDLPLRECAERFATVSIPQRHPGLALSSTAGLHPTRGG